MMDYTIMGLTNHHQSTPADKLMVGRWVQLQQEMVQQQQQRPQSMTSDVAPRRRTAGHHHRQRSKSVSHLIGSYRDDDDHHHRIHQQPVESLTVTFSKLLVNQINGSPLVAETKSAGHRKKKTRNSRTKKSQRPSSSSTSRSISAIRNNKPVIKIDHVEDWLHQRSAHYAWWRKPTTPSTGLDPILPASNSARHRPSSKSNNHNRTAIIEVNHVVAPSHHPAGKSVRCVLWFIFTGNPSKSIVGSSDNRRHSIRIEQQPLGGNSAVVFAAELRLGEEFGIVSRRQPGFTLSLTFFIDGVRHARLSGCCESARNVHLPTRVGGPIGAFLLKAVQGGEACQICQMKSIPFANPGLFTVWPKSPHHHHSKTRISTSGKIRRDDRHNVSPTIKDPSSPAAPPSVSSSTSSSGALLTTREPFHHQPAISPSIEEVFDFSPRMAESISSVTPASSKSSG